MGLKIDSKAIARVAAKKASGAKDKLIEAADATKGKTVSAAEAAASKASAVVRERKASWLNPLFLEQYQAPNFDMPKLLVIADEDLRKGNELCEGAIGWLNTRHVPEVIFMYEEFVDKSGVFFNPWPMCGSAYYRHPFDKNVYLQVKDYLHICKRDQLTELKNIACLLGAVHCSVEVHEEKGLFGSFGGSANSSINQSTSPQPAEKRSAGTSETLNATFSNSESLSVVMNEYFEAGAMPKRPQLQWFKSDNEILSLVEKRCNPDAGGVLSSYSIDITSSTLASISVDWAAKIDASLRAAKVKAGGSLSAGLKKEEKKRFIYKIEF